MARRRDVVAGLTALAVCGGGRAWAGGRLGVAPTLLEMDGRDGNRLLYVNNGGDGPLTVQVRLFAWRNVDEREDLTPTDEIAFSPGQFTVQSGGRQVVRLAARTPPGERERAYRIVVDQLPGLERGGVEMPVRMMVPLFVAAAAPERGEPRLDWSATLDRASGEVTLAAANPGRRRVRLAELAWEADGRRTVIAAGLAGYALAGETWLCRFPMIGDPASLRISARTERGAINADVPLAVA